MAATLLNRLELHYMIKCELSGFYCGVSTRDSYLLLDDVLDFCILIYLYDASLASRPLATYILN